MADILISRQDYNPDDAGKQLNGWKPNVISGAITGTEIAASGTADIPADFKDHKTVFVIDAAAAGNVTFKAGDTYQGVNDLIVEAEAGVNMIWLDSAKFVDKTTGKITIESEKAITIFGYEMR